MILFSNDLKWNNHVVCIRNSASFNNNFQIIWQSHIGFIIISYLFWMDIDMDFSIATASKNMLLSHKTAMWNKQFDGWINGWMDGRMDGLIDWMTDRMIDWLIDWLEKVKNSSREKLLADSCFHLMWNFSANCLPTVDSMSVMCRPIVS